MTWNNSNPALGNSIAADVVDIKENFQHSHDSSGNVDTVLAGADGDIDANGTKIILDADQDTSITADTDDQIDLECGGSDIVSVTSSGVAVTGNVSATGNVTASGYSKPAAQPAFYAYSSSAQNNIALGTAVTVVFGTEEFDLGNDFASNTFTAPLTGYYQINVNLELKNVDSSATTYFMTIVRSTGSDIVKEFSPAGFAYDVGYLPFQFAGVLYLEASETVHVTVQQTGGTQQTDIGNNRTNFSGFMVA